MEAEGARRVAFGALAAMLGVLAGWKAPAAAAAGPVAVMFLAVVAAPLVAVLGGVAAGRIRAGRAGTLALPFYAAGFLTEAVADPASRGWAAAGAFATALAFVTLIAWVRRA